MPMLDIVDHHSVRDFATKKRNINLPTIFYITGIYYPFQLRFDAVLHDTSLSRYHLLVDYKVINQESFQGIAES
jgi:hypothetical protein